MKSSLIITLKMSLLPIYLTVSFAILQIISSADVKSILDGGTPVEKHEFPWMLGLINKSTGKLFCGGSILSEIHLITSGRCVYEWFNGTTRQVDPSSIKIIAGDNDRMEEEGSEQIVDVLEIHVYPGFVYDENYKPGQSGVASARIEAASKDKASDADGFQGFQNDMAILTVSPPFNFTDDVKPIKILDEVLDYGETLILAGWGITDKKQNTIPTGKALKKVKIPYSEEAKTSGKFGLYSKYASGEVIEFNTGIGNNKGLMGRCIGDPGGAVVCETTMSSKDYFLCGVISFGIWCDRYNPTGRLVGVQEYTGWINSIIGSKLWAYFTFAGIMIGIITMFTTGILIRKRRQSYKC